MYTVPVKVVVACFVEGSGVTIEAVEEGMIVDGIVMSCACCSISSGSL